MAVIPIQELNGTPLEQNTRPARGIFEPVGPSDANPPVVTVLTTPPIYRDSVVVVNVTDNKTLALVEMYLVNPNGSRDVIYSGADGFIYPYLGSNVTPITNGLQFEIQRSGGWQNTPTFKVRAIDGGLNEA